MKILHISSSDSMGGAAKSAMRLHLGLLNNGINSIYFSAEKTTANKTVKAYKNGYLKRRLLATIDSVLMLFYKNRTRDYPFTSNWFPFTGIVKEIDKIKPDIIHIHWVGKGMIRLEDLLKFKVPILWTMHDNYVFTGGCHLVNDCINYKSECNTCPQLNSKKTNDLSNWNFKRKQKIYNKLQNITFIAPSKWMQNLATESALLKDKSIVHLPNVIDANSYFPINKVSAKLSALLPPDKKIILFGAVSATQDVNKGFKELMGALEKLPDLKDRVELCVFGAEKPETEIFSNFKTHYTGYLNDALSKRILYSAADVVVVPSKVENLSNVIMESMACATPVVAFNVGGNSDMIEHKNNGYLAKQNDINDLALGINWVLDNSDAEQLNNNAIKNSNQKFEQSVLINKYINLYKSLHEKK